MDPSKSDRLTLNFSVRRGTHTKLKAIMAEIDAAALESGEKDPDGNIVDRCETWEQLMEHVARRTIEVAWDIMDVDDEDPRRHTVTFRLGDQIYKWDGDKSILLYDSTRREKTVRAFVSLGKALSSQGGG